MNLKVKLAIAKQKVSRAKIRPINNSVLLNLSTNLIYNIGSLNVS
jgi:hypothetical protein